MSTALSRLAMRADARVTRRHRTRMRLARELYPSPAFDRLVQLTDEAQVLARALWALVGPDPLLGMIRHAPEPPDGPDESQE